MFDRFGDMLKSECACMISFVFITAEREQRVNLLNMQPRREKKAEPPCKCKFACHALVPAAGFNVLKGETESIGVLFEQMGVSHISVVFLPSVLQRPIFMRRPQVHVAVRGATFLPV